MRITSTAEAETVIQVATSGTNAGVVYAASGRVTFELFALDGTAVAGTRRRLDVRAASGETQPDILWNGSEYVVIYQDLSPSHARELTLQRIALDGSLSGSPVNISAVSAFPTTWRGQLHFAYSPISGYAVVSERGFQYLGPTGTTPAAEYSIPSIADAAIAADPTGQWGVFVVGNDHLYVFNADGSLTRPHVHASLPYITGDETVSLVHDGTTWALSYPQQVRVGLAYRDRIILRRGESLENVHVVHEIPSPIGLVLITKTKLHLSGTTLLVSFTEYGMPDFTMSAMRLRLSGAATDAPTVLTWPFQVVSSPTVYEANGVEMVTVSPTRLFGAWNDTRWGAREAYAVSVPIDACP